MDEREHDLIPELPLREQIDQLRKQREQEFIARIEALSAEYGLTLRAVPMVGSDGRLTAQVVVAER